MHELLARLNGLGVRLSVSDGKLKVNAPAGVLTDDLVAALRMHKQLLLEALAGSAPVDDAPTPAVPRGGDLPCSAAQERLWIVQQLGGHAQAYNVPAAFELHGALDVPALDSALRDLRGRHEALRTTFDDGNGVPVQRIVPEGDAASWGALTVRDSSDAVLAEDVDRCTSRVFDLRSGPCFDATLLRVSPVRHVLVLCLHHIVADGWSLDVLLGDLAELYAARLAGVPARLAPLEIQYADYAVWQRSAAGGGSIRAQLEYWTRRLGGAPALLPLPTDHARPAVQDHAGATLSFELGAETAQRLKACALAERATPFMAALAAFNAFLAHVAGESDVVVGTPIANRPRPELAPVVGCFVNTLALRTQVDERADFATLVRAVRETTLDAFGHQDVPFEQVVEALRPERSMSHTPVFQVAFAYDGAGASARGWTLPGLDVGPVERPGRHAKFDLTLSLHETSAGSISGTLEYAAALFERATIAGWAHEFTAFVDRLVRAPGRAVGDLYPASAAARARPSVLVGAAPSDRRSPPVTATLETHAIATPHAVAVSMGAQELTWAQLHRRATRLAAVLRTRVQGEARVGVCLPRSPDMVVAMWAVWKAGACWIPLDASYPRERLAYMCTDAQVDCVIGNEATRALCAELARPVIDVDRDVDRDVERGRHETDVACAAPGHADARLAYVIYTSGSTGRPKGVMTTHGALAELLAWYRDEAALRPGDRASQLAQFGFDAAVLDTWGTLSAGATLCIADADTRADVTRLARWLADESIAVSFMPTPLAEEILAARPALPALRWLGCGGDRLKHRPRADASFHMLNAYGPTEATVVSLAGTVSHDASTPITIGRPLPGTRAYVLDASLEPAEVGHVGELFVAGGHLARGYLDRPALSAERFLPDPLATTPGARMYRTGDRVRVLADGQVEFVGRIDDQVKLRGFRIEVGEVEAALADLPGITDVAVVVRPTPAGQPALVAYVTCDTDAADPRELRDALALRLPSYMVPALIEQLASMPLSPGGKVARDALPAPTWPDGSDDVPASALESELVGTWASLLAVEKVGTHDDFFALGGHSLLAARMLAAVHARHGVSIALGAFFQSPTVAALAALLADASAASAHAPIPLAPRNAPLPLSFAQRRLWFLAQLDARSNAYAMPLVLELRGPLQVDALRGAFVELQRRHEVLRVRFADVDGEPVQWPVDDVVDLAHEHVAPADVDAAVEQVVGAPIDLEREPVVRARLFSTSATQHVLAVAIHHIAADGWSIGLLADDLARLYAVATDVACAQIPAVGLSYLDFAAWHRRDATGPQADRSLAYWTDTLRDLPAVLDLPSDRPRRASPGGRSGDAALVVDATVVAALRTLAREEGGTLFMALLAAFKVLLARLSGQWDVCVGTPVAHRDRAELQAVVGLLLGTLPLRTRLDATGSARDTLRQVRDAVVGAFAHQSTPFEHIVDALAIERDLSRHPVFQVFFNMLEPQDDSVAAPEWPGVSVSARPAPPQAAKFDLTFYVAETADGLRVHAHYDADLFDAVRIQGLLEQYRELLAELATDPDRPVAAMSLRTAAMRAQLPQPDTALPTDWRGSITDWFARQCAARPEHPAVVARGMTLCYRDLDAASNRLAHALLGRGVGAGDVVAVHASRCGALAVAVLGVLKAGAAFMILDAAYPEGRLEFALDSVAPAAWLAVGDVPALSAALSAKVDAMGFRLALDDTLSALDAYPPAAPPRADTGPDSLSHVALTSGSTGRPKIIRGRHGPFTHFMPWFVDAFGLGADDRFSVLSGLSHDPLQRDLLWPLMLGGTACVPHPDCMVPGALAEWMREHDITVANLTPAMTQLLADGGTHGSLASLRRAFIVGDVLARDVVRRLTALAPVCRTVSFYGATETQWALAYEPADADAVEPWVAIGRGIPGVELLLVNAAGTPAGVGELAEVCIRSAHLSAGYWHDDTATDNDRFLAANAAAPAVRTYRTGDLGRYLPDGRVRGAGRADRQLSVRGFRVEPAEVEAVLAADPGVRQAAVVPVRGGDGAVDGLAAFVEIRAGLEPAPAVVARLRASLLAALPGYMQPRSVSVLDRMPLSPSGKVDRRALEREARDVVPSESSSPLVTSLEHRVAEAIASVIRRPVSGRDDDFFALGGNSLQAMQLVARLRRAFGRVVPVRLVFDCRTVRALAAALASADDGAIAMPAIDVRPERRRAPLSSNQQRLWFLAGLDGDSTHYHMMAAVRLRGPLDARALRTATDRVVARHAALRTRIEAKGADVWQVILPDNVGLAWEEGAVAEDALAGWVADFGARPFDLEREPGVRAALVAISERDHAFLLSVHHLFADGWSIGVLLEDLAAGYRSALTGAADTQPAPDVQYGDYAEWQRDVAASSALQAQRQYWEQALRGLPPLLSLPTDRPRPALPSHSGGRVPIAVEADLHRRAREFCLAEQITPFMLLMAAWQCLLARYAGVDDLCVGFPVAGRHAPGVERTVGFFAGTLALRLAPRMRQTVHEFLQHVRERTLEAYANQDVPFEAVVDLVRPERSLAHSPVFQTMFNLQNLGAAPLVLDGLDVEPLPRPQPGTRFDLTLVLSEGADGWWGELEFARDLFDLATAKDIARQYRAVLDAMISTPGARLESLALGGREDRVAPQLPWAFEAVHRAVERHATERPDRIAVEAGGERLDYAELDERARRAARALRARGIGAEARVALASSRTADAIACVVGILRCGGTVLPLDADMPAPRLAAMLHDADVSLVIFDGTARPIPGLGVPWVRACDLLAEPMGAAQGADHAHIPHPMQAAYAIFTSGTTGAAKAAVIPHGAWARLADVQRRTLAVAPGDRVLQFVSQAFDVSMGDIALALSSGATLVVADDELRRNPEQLPAFIAAHDIQHAQLPVGLVTALPALASSRLKSVVAGGESMPVALVDRWDGAAALYNAYGPTETTVMAAWAPLGRGSGVHVGDAIDGSRIHVLDAGLRPVPDGAVGELWIAGDCVGRGYLGKPALTAAAFLPDPFGPSGARMYRTGDRGRRRSGVIEVLGRVDAQIKLRGYRFEPGDVEDAIRTFPGVRQVAVGIVETAAGARRLAAWVAPASDAQVAALQAHVAERLPAYMRPAVWVAMSALPLTANGKVDRRALPEPPSDAARAQDAAHDDTLSPAEAAFLSIWNRVLGTDGARLDDDFFANGGDSLLSMQVVGLAERDGWIVSTRDIFEHATPRALARVARSTAAGAARCSSGAAPGQPLPLAPIQRWFLQTFRHAPHQWNHSILLEPSPDVDRRDAARAVLAVQARHEALRLRVSAASRQQTISPEPVDLEHVVLDAAAEDFAQALHAWCEVRQPAFKLDGASPLLRVAWIESACGTQRRLWLLAHHFLVDAASWRIVLGDLEQLLDSDSATQDGRRPVRTPWSSWLLRSETAAAEDAWREQRAYWQRSASVAAACEDNALQPGREADTRVVRRELGRASTVQLLEHTHRALGFGVDTMLVCAVALAWRDWRACSDVSLTLETHGRDADPQGLDLSQTVGWLTAAYPLALRLPAGPDLLAAVEAVRSQMLAVPEAGARFMALAWPASGPGTTPADHSPIALNYLGRTSGGPGGRLRPARESTGPTRSPGERRPHAIDVLALVEDDVLQVDVRFNRHACEEADVARYADRVLAHLQALATLAARTDACMPTLPAAAASAALVPLRRDGDRTPLFCVHPAGGSAACYRDLASALGDEQPVFGLQAPGLVGDWAVPATFDAMASVFVTAMRQVQPHGPYRLLGWSQGGAIAYAIACELERQGEPVAMLAMLDTAFCKAMLATNAPESERDQLVTYLADAGLQVADDVYAGLDFDALARLGRKRAALPDGLTDAQLRRVLRVQHSIGQGARSFEPRPARFPVTLLRARDDGMFAHLGPRLGWPEGCGQWRTPVVVPGDHYTCIGGTHVAALARALRHLLDEHEREGGRTGVGTECECSA